MSNSEIISRAWKKKTLHNYILRPQVRRYRFLTGEWVKTINTPVKQRVKPVELYEMSKQKSIAPGCKKRYCV